MKLTFYGLFSIDGGLIFVAKAKSKKDVLKYFIDNYDTDKSSTGYAEYEIKNINIYKLSVIDLM